MPSDYESVSMTAPTSFNPNTSIKKEVKARVLSKLESESDSVQALVYGKFDNGDQLHLIDPSKLNYYST